METRLGESLCWCHIGVEFSSKICPVIYTCLSASWQPPHISMAVPCLKLRTFLPFCPLGPQPLSSSQRLGHSLLLHVRVMARSYPCHRTQVWIWDTLLHGRCRAWGHAVWQVVLQGKKFRVNEWAKLPGWEQSFGWLNPGTKFSPKWP